jgi:DNA-binding transcriptional MerR regulator
VSAATPHPATPDAALRIGEVAEQAAVSPRTLRYYEELGLVVPSGRSAGGTRRYSEHDVARVLRIRELQELLGFDLCAIGEVLRAEDQLADLRRQFERGADVARRRAILAEAVAINARLRAVVRAKQERLDAMMHDLEANARRYRARAREIDARHDEGAPPDASTRRVARHETVGERVPGRRGGGAGVGRARS